MTNIEATASVHPIAPSDQEPSSTVVDSCPDPACAPSAVSNKSTCAASDSASTLSPPTAHRIVTTVSSDESTKEVASASPDEPAVKDDNVPPVVHQPSTKSNDGIVSAPIISHATATTTKSNAGDATAALPDAAAKATASALKDDHFKRECLPSVVHRPGASNSFARAAGTSHNTTDTSIKSSDIATVFSDAAATEEASALKENHLVKECLPPVVHRPSASNTKDEIVSARAPGTSQSHAHDESGGTDITTAVPSDQLSNVALKSVRTDTFATAKAKVSNNVVACASHHVSTGEICTTETEATGSSRVLTASLPTIEVGGMIAKRLDGVSIVAAPAKNNAIEYALAKKRQSEEEQLMAKKKAKVPKDPNAPKKNKTPYMHYATYARAWIKARNPNVAASDATNTVREGWKEMPDEARRFWNEKSAADKARYEKELTEYELGQGQWQWQANVAAASKQASSKPTIDATGGMKKAEYSNAPKPNKSAFMHYIGYALTQIGLTCPQMEDAEVTKSVQSGWDNMVAEVRNYWDGIAAADKVRYQQELILFKAGF